MSKSKYTAKWYDHDDSYDYYENPTSRERRKKEKRLNSALKTKNVHDLIRLSDDEYDLEEDT